MVTPREPLGIDTERAAEILSPDAEIKSADEMMLVMSWKGMEVTVYAQGKIMFHPLDGRDDSVAYANEILGVLIG